MKKHPSLARRLSVHLLALLLLGSIAISLAYMVLSLTGIAGLPPVALNDLAEGPGARAGLQIHHARSRRFTLYRT